MQRLDINKRLSFAEAENGQKDRNKEEVEEERELATEKGINKLGGGRTRRKRERKSEKEREESAAPAAGPYSQVPSRFTRPTSRSTTFAVHDMSFRIGKLLFPPCARSWQVSLSEEPLLSQDGF